MPANKVLALLKKGRRWFEKPGSTVKDWTHRIERKNGRICRCCLLGAISVRGGLNGTPTHDAELLVIHAKNKVTGRFIDERHSRLECLAIYDRAIELAEAES